jgi:hypothetical protein
MKQRLLIALLTIIVLGAGYAGGVWTERHSCKVPPAPALLGELSSKAAPNAKPNPMPPPNAAALAAEIERLRPQIEKFRARIEELDEDVDRGIEAILTPAQRDLYEVERKKHAESVAKSAAESALKTPLTSEEIANLQQRPLYKLLWIVVVPLRLDSTTRDLKLDDAQREKVRELLRVRREKFLQLVDSSPPPSLMLSRLAPVAQRLGEPKK